MKRRKWDPKTKAMIVMEGLKGKPVAEICIERQISQAQYYQWREQFLGRVSQVFVDDSRREKALAKENARLKRIIGDLTVELKKPKSGYDEAQRIGSRHGAQFRCSGTDQAGKSGSPFLGLPAYMGTPEVCG